MAEVPLTLMSAQSVDALFKGADTEVTLCVGVAFMRAPGAF